MKDKFEITESECAVLEDLFNLCNRDTGNYVCSIKIERDKLHSYIIPTIMRDRQK